MSNPSFDEVTPHPDGFYTGELDQVHERAYVVRSYRKGDDMLIIRGAVRDQKPPGIYVVDDPEPLTVHHMILDMYVTLPDLVITEASVVMEVHPHTTCPAIEVRYQDLAGLSITRGFTHKVRELFGGPRGCTHITALLQAMAPVAMQSRWSFRASQLREMRLRGEQVPISPFADPDARKRALTYNVNTCHVWAEDGQHVVGARAGEPMEVPLWITARHKKLGRPMEDWDGD